MNPSVEALRGEFAGGIGRAEESCGATIVYVEADRLVDVMRWLRDTPEQEYDYLVDLTAVDYRDPERSLEVVYQLRSLKRGDELRVKVALAKDTTLEVGSVYDLWRAADWMEREVFDMFGVSFPGHPDLRRILMWETYQEGFPLRKDFPLRGRFSRAEQVRQALHANPEAHYSLEELRIEQVYRDLPSDMRDRLERGERDQIPALPSDQEAADE